MPSVAASRDGAEQGLSEHEQRIATAILYTRFRRSFSGVTRVPSRDGRASLAVWDGVAKVAPLFRICRFDGGYIAIDDAANKVLSADTLEDLLEAVRDIYPPSAAF